MRYERELFLLSRVSVNVSPPRRNYVCPPPTHHPRRTLYYTKLNLNPSQITDVGCHRLANALGPLKVLYTLDLCHNPFGDKACLSIATYLSQPSCPLRSLSVAGCLDVDPGAWKTINARGSEGMVWNPPRPGDDGAVSLAAALMSPHGCGLRYTVQTTLIRS